MPPKIRFISLPPTSYSALNTHQSTLVSSFLHSKKYLTPPPPATILSTTISPPIYTLGRRERLSSLTPAELAFLRAFPADVQQTQRGGQTTFHGPGQAVVYPILDIKAFGLTARDWVCTLEKAVLRALKGLGVGSAHTNEHTGVWVDSKDGVERKIASLGLHLQRNVSGHGISVNVEGEKLLEGLNRIVACGLIGREQTSIEREGGYTGLGVEGVGKVLGIEIARGLGAELEEGNPWELGVKEEMGSF